MSSQFIQLIRIRIRNAGVIAFGCLMDGLLYMIDAFLWADGLRSRAYRFRQLVGDRSLCLHSCSPQRYTLLQSSTLCTIMPLQ